ncbi:MAG: glycoside hydrolase family 15 protein [Candidatus Nanopelagicales bacterium]
MGRLWRVTNAAYPPIADHGLIGDLQTSALVGLDGTISWFCSPRFDSPSVFGSILDAERGGFFRVTVDDPDVVVKQLYLVDTAILITRYLTSAGVGEVIDFMPIDRPEVATDIHRIVRLARVVRGEVTFTMECAPRFDYGRVDHELTLTDHHALFSTPDQEISLHTQRILDHSEGKQIHNGVARSRFTLKQGEVAGCTLTTGLKGATAGSLSVRKVVALFEDTIKFWRDWIGKSTYKGRWRQTVNRSAVTLKLLTYAPTGALVAAPTAGLPEQIGGERNWDYRYTWIRDGSFSVAALMELGYSDEAAAFLKWISRLVADHAGGPAGPLRLMYRVDGTPDLEEFDLPNWQGYAESSPVRIGNGAADQLQLDIYGEAVDAIYELVKRGRSMYYDTWLGMVGILDWLTDNWDRPDEGIWETRGGQKDFVYSRVMCWVAFDRAMRIAAMKGLPAPLERWRKTRDRIYLQVMERGYNEEIGAFVQYYGSDVLDASLLKMPLVGFIAPRDPRWVSTLDAMNREIVSDSLVFRYNPGASPDGLAGDEGTFSLCSFWYVDALAQAGRLAEARYIFEQMQTYSNHLGLYSEEIGFTGEQLGNFPQAFTHLALIHAAVTLNTQLDENPVAYESLIQIFQAQTGRY